MAQLFAKRLSQQILTNKVLTNGAQLWPLLSKTRVEPKRQLFGFGKNEDDVKLADPIEHATGLEKLLLLAEEKGIDDPFCLKPRVRGSGTKENPNLVPTFEEKRFIGCLCEEDATHLCYMWIHLGEPKRCECGHWFKAVPAQKFWEEIDTKMGV